MRRLLRTLLVLCMLVSGIESADAQLLGRRLRRAVNDAVGGATEGVFEELTRSFLDPFIVTPEEHERAYQEKRKKEAREFGRIITYNNAHHSPQGDLVRRIVEDSKKYHDSLTTEQLREYHEFYKNTEEGRERTSELATKYAVEFGWSLFPVRLDLAEKHLLYNRHRLAGQLNEAYQERSRTKLVASLKELRDFKTTLNPPRS